MIGSDREKVFYSHAHFHDKKTCLATGQQGLHGSVQEDASPWQARTRRGGCQHHRVPGLGGRELHLRPDSGRGRREVGRLPKLKLKIKERKKIPVKLLFMLCRERDVQLMLVVVKTAEYK